MEERKTTVLKEAETLAGIRISYIVHDLFFLLHSSVSVDK